MLDKLRWGIISTASIAPCVMEGIRRSSTGVVAAVASRTAERAETWAREHGVPRAFGSYEAMLESGEVDAVYNPLPNSLHAEWTIRAIEAGLPVLCEKPFTANAAEARAVAEASRKTGKLVMEAFMYRYHPLHDALIPLIRDGAIGEVRCVHSTFTWYLDDRTQVPASAELAGGALMDVGCYPVNFARLIAGCEPVRAAAFQHCLGAPASLPARMPALHGTDVDDTLAGVLEFPNGMIGEVECSIESFERVRADIVGTKGMITLERPFNPGDDRGELILRREGSEERIVTPGANRYQLEVEDFTKSVLTGQPPRWPVEDAIANMAAIDALLASARTGAVVRVEPA